MILLSQKQKKKFNFKVEFERIISTSIFMGNLGIFIILWQLILLIKSRFDFFGWLSAIFILSLSVYNVAVYGYYFIEVFRRRKKK